MLDLSVERKQRSSYQPVEQQSHLHQDEKFQDKPTRQNKLRTACDTCHSSKIRCCGGTPCNACRRLQVNCIRSASSRQGRPKGVKNKKTAEKEASGSKSSQGMDSSGQDNAELNSLDSSAESAVTADFPVPSTSDPDVFWSLCAPISPGALAVAGGAASPGAFFGSNDMFMDTSQDAFQSLDAWDTDMGDAQLQQKQNDSRNHDHHGHASLDASLSGDARSGSAPPSTRALHDSLRLSCNCLERFAQLLSNLKMLALTISSSRRTDAVLLCTRTASGAWKQMLQCIPCRENSAEEVLYLSISGIRIALRNLDMLFSQPEVGDGGVDATATTGANSEAERASDSCAEDYFCSAANQMLNESLQPSKTSSASLGTVPLPTPPGTAGSVHAPRRRHSMATFALGSKYSALGSYHMDAEEQQVVAKIIALRLVREIQEILQALKERLQSRSTLSAAASYSDSSNNSNLFGELGSADVGCWNMATAFGESLMHLQPLLESAEKTSDILLHRLRNLSTSHLERL